MTDDSQTLLQVADISVCVILLIVLKMRVRKTKRHGLRELLGPSGITLALVFFLIQAAKVVVWSQA
ncbi:hypothetical protein RLEG12_02225 (plasmid) [Rhizobium leguminosarum bv. trifolii CB782]|uniref:Uncharacterized protein n=1 Tax=Rhizobium hidalgonense TaxID=1538159 RepID=A0ABX4JKZ8_9HYPH|nr:hypothetical protein RLEG12_02225 [Rhizobium leguminosarum bv. trifolii CB782]PDT20708.1 hypothetical protein CO674_26165 [Rhizobium hidalgonense]PON06942.1 hypothetical protein ATY29_13820 [Rhizobium hidalgonense]